MPDRHQKSSSKNIWHPIGLVRICWKRVITIFLKFTFAVLHLQPYAFQTLETNFIALDFDREFSLEHQTSTTIKVLSCKSLPLIDCVKLLNPYGALAGFLREFYKLLN